MQRASQFERSSDPRQRAPPVVVSLGVTLAFAALVTLAFVALAAPLLFVAFLTGVLTALALHAVRTRLASRRRATRRGDEANGRPA